MNHIRPDFYVVIERDEDGIFVVKHLSCARAIVRAEPLTS
jgi:hypothetical protein